MASPRAERICSACLHSLRACIALGQATVLCFAGMAGILVAHAETPQRVIIHYVERQVGPEPALSNFDPPPRDEGVKGAELGLADNNTSGRFVGLVFDMRLTRIGPDDDFAARMRELRDHENPRHLIVNAPAADLLTAADAFAGTDALLFNTGAVDTSLRDQNCRTNVLHTLPSQDMLTDALAQFLLIRRWKKIFLLSGVHNGDRAYTDAFRHSARKFGAQIVAEKTFDAKGADLRRNAGAELTVQTQGADYDVVVVADTRNGFGAYLPYNTWLPRPVAGTHGLTAVAWARSIEAYGAAQLQGRFLKFAGRPMTGVDYSSWLAVRAIGEAALRSTTADPHAISAALRSEAFEIAGFKGRTLSFRPWNGQLRQPIHLVWPGEVVAVAPLDGFLHQRTELDTLGTDMPETVCRKPS